MSRSSGPGTLSVGVGRTPVLGKVGSLLCVMNYKAAVFLSGSGLYPKVDCRDDLLGRCGYGEVVEWKE